MNKEQVINLTTKIIIAICGGVAAKYGFSDNLEGIAGTVAPLLVAGGAWLYTHGRLAAAVPDGAVAGGTVEPRLGTTTTGGTPVPPGRVVGLAVVIAALALASGCATYQKTTTITFNKDGSTNAVVIAESGRTDPLLTKTMEQDNTGSGVDLDFCGLANYFSPFHLKFGNFGTTYSSLPTAEKPVFTAPYNTTSHENASIIQHAADRNVSTTTNLPPAAFVGPNVQVLNPIVQPTVSTGTNSVVP